ncbi:ectoine hydroxylase [Glycomyces buryatensis]|uniref:Ectoine hydroxylase n=1 Tax=Glycomyces buryatensis TaxID=2570927 RepID=A0A4S8Q661_9ACTN|nr:ectoine hydroxylase [Glycomyces buryatensis]THV39807.1 ectoine hydroxylase [Glycomyces buryatensis]
MSPRDLYPTRDATEARLIYRTEDPTVWGSPGYGPLTAEQLDGHERDGFTSIEQLLEPAELADAQAELERLVHDDTLEGDERVVRERASNEVRSVFDVHRLSKFFAELVRDERIVGAARQILGSEVYVHQSRVNSKPGFGGAPFEWHSDFETWHAEDGMPRMRAVSLSLALTENFHFNGSLMIMPGSHRTFVSCVGETPEDNYKSSLKQQEAGVPDQMSVRLLADRHGIHQFTGPAGSAIWFDSNCMHGSNGNITPFPRSNLFIVFNSVDNALVEPYAASSPRPEYLGSRDWEVLR